MHFSVRLPGVVTQLRSILSLARLQGPTTPLAAETHFSAEFRAVTTPRAAPTPFSALVQDNSIPPAVSMRLSDLMRGNPIPSVISIRRSEVSRMYLRIISNSHQPLERSRG